MPPLPASKNWSGCLPGKAPKNTFVPQGNLPVPVISCREIVMLAPQRPRIAIYGRHSTSMQTATSSADQAASCSKLVAYLGGEVVATYLDPEQSGYRRYRSGLKQLIHAIENNEVDVVVCEALDRLARDAEDIAWL